MSGEIPIFAEKHNIMKDNYIHVCFIIDESGSMVGSESDVTGGFSKMLDEQKSVEGGKCSISLYKFSDTVSKVYVGRDASEVEPIKAVSLKYAIFGDDNNAGQCDPNIYSPHGCTAMYDGIGTAVDEIGEWLNAMPEDERPSKNLIVIMTDGEENASRKYGQERVREMIRHQEEKYNWTFIYMGTDITTTDYADSIGITKQAYASKEDHATTYASVCSIVTGYRGCTDIAGWEADMGVTLDGMNSVYVNKTGVKL